MRSSRLIGKRSQLAKGQLAVALADGRDPTPAAADLNLTPDKIGGRETRGTARAVR